MLRDIFVSLFHLANVQFRKSFSFLERDGWRVAVTSSRSLASTGGEGSILPLLRLSPRDPLRWAPAGSPKTAPRVRERVCAPVSSENPSASWSGTDGASSPQAPYFSLPPAAKAQPFRCGSSPRKTRCAGLLRGPRKTAPGCGRLSGSRLSLRSPSTSWSGWGGAVF